MDSFFSSSFNSVSYDPYVACAHAIIDKLTELSAYERETAKVAALTKSLSSNDVFSDCPGATTEIRERYDLELDAAIDPIVADRMDKIALEGFSEAGLGIVGPLYVWARRFIPLP